MAATKEDISSWFDDGLKQGATHMIIVCDTYDWDDYPVYILKDEKIKHREKEYDGINMQKIMEVYNLSLVKEGQLNESRAFNY